jgi:tRNA threonylcarbamoyladenosine biosynthesis protein TsaB
MGLVDELFREASLEPGELEAVACMRGPGSFTGLRIGFAAAKGMALALGIPLIACPTLDCMVQGQLAWQGLVLPVIDARRQRFYTALYSDGRRISPEMDADPATIAACIAESGISPVMFTGPDAPLLISRLEALDTERHLDPLHAKGRGLELLAVAKNMVIVNNKMQNDVMSGPEYIRGQL